ncbi:MAG: hypothetical protein HYX65_05935 [Gemmatimonadetes bacterium]|nr:hypothetical protein [Gemmatimonadota bacterium]
MDKRLVIALLAVAAVVYACGPRTHAAERTAQRHDANASAAVVGKVDVTTAPVVTFLLEVTNKTGKVVELTFPSAQTHDFAVLDAGGREVWRWSRGEMFTQVLRNEPLGRGASVTYSETWPEARPGTYTLVASTNSSNHPVEERTSFTVR